jgi:hypothetical protein
MERSTGCYSNHRWVISFRNKLVQGKTQGGIWFLSSCGNNEEQVPFRRWKWKRGIRNKKEAGKVPWFLAGTSVWVGPTTEETLLGKKIIYIRHTSLRYSKLF